MRLFFCDFITILGIVCLIGFWIRFGRILVRMIAFGSIVSRIGWFFSGLLFINGGLLVIAIVMLGRVGCFIVSLFFIDC